MNIDETLDKAAELIELDGWTQGTFHHGGRHCALGAIAKVVSGVDHQDSSVIEQLLWEEYDAADAHVALVETIGGVTVAEWNDKPGRTGAEVVAALRNTAERIRMS